jgi:hypothetical protein
MKKIFVVLIVIALIICGYLYYKGAFNTAPVLITQENEQSTSTITDRPGSVGISCGVFYSGGGTSASPVEIGQAAACMDKNFKTCTEAYVRMTSYDTNSAAGSGIKYFTVKKTNDTCSIQIQKMDGELVDTCKNLTVSGSSIKSMNATQCQNNNQYRIF